MIFAVADREKRELVIAGADSIDAQRAFISSIIAKTPQLLQDTDFSRFLIDRNLSRFKMTPTIFEFASADDIDGFVSTHEIEVISFDNAIERQKTMLDAEDFNDSSGRTIGEITGLDEHDPFDLRTDEEKAEAEQKREEMSKKRKAGDLTGDSFGGGPRTKSAPKSSEETEDEDEDDGSGINIRDMRIEIDKETGEVRIERVLADKDLFAHDYYHISIKENGEKLIGKEAYQSLLKRAGLADTNRYFGADYRVDPEGGILIKLAGASLQRMKEALVGLDHEMNYVSGTEDDTSDNPLKIADDDMVEVYFRVEAQRDLMSVMEMIAAGPQPYRTGSFTTFPQGGCWLVYVRRQSAEDVVEILRENNIAAEVVDVDRNGLRIIEEGVDYATVIDTGAANVEPPLPWNSGAPEFAAMEEKEQRKVLRGCWLLYTVRKHDHPHGVIVHITPKSYFNENDKMWDGELPIDHLLTDNFVKFGDKVGVYQVKSLDLNTTDFLLGNKAGMKESLMLRMHVNSLGGEAH